MISTLVPVRSSWLLDVDGLRLVGTKPGRNYRCNACGRRGHNARTCTEPQ